jgi:hypothetical protein
MFRRLRHYGMYLDPDNPEDAEMIQRLEPYRKSKRVGELLRQALRHFFGGGPAQQATQATPPMPRAAHEPPPLPPAQGDAESAKAKVRGSFLK